MTEQRDTLRPVSKVSRLYVLATLAYGVGGFVSTVTFWVGILLRFHQYAAPGSLPPYPIVPDPAWVPVMSFSLGLAFVLIGAWYRFKDTYNEWLRNGLWSFLVGGFLPYPLAFLLVLVRPPVF